MKRSGGCVLCGLAVAMLSVAAFADEAGQVFESLYGPKIKQVSATVDRADDIALAKEMLAVAKDSGSTPRLQALLCDAAGDLAGKHPDGFAVAVEAMQLLAGAQEGQRDAARVKLIDLLTKQSRTGKAEERAAASDELIDLLMAMGDEKAEKKQYAEAAADYRRANTVAVQRKSDQLDAIKAKTEFAAARDRAVKQIARLQEKLLKDANDHAAAEEIVKLYVVELDEPASASPFLSRVKDEKQKTLIPLAVQSTTDLKDQELLALAEWYAGLANEVGTDRGIGLLQRAAVYWERFLEVHAEDDLTRRKATIQLGATKALIAKAGDAARVRGRTAGNSALPQKNRSDVIDLLKSIDSKAATTGKWTLDKGVLRSTTNEVSQFSFPADLTTDYRLAVRITRNGGNDQIAITVPVGERHVTCVFDSYPGEGFHSGFGRIGSKPAHQNASVVHGRQFDAGKSYTLAIDVRSAGEEAALTCTVDGKVLLKWRAAPDSLSAQWATPPKRSIGILAYKADFTVHAMEVSTTTPRVVETNGPDVGAKTPSTKRTWTLLLANDDDRHGFTIHVNGKEMEYPVKRPTNRSAVFEIEGGFDPKDVVVVKTDDRGTGAFAFCLLDEKGTLVSYSHEGLPLHGDGDGLKDFLAGKTGSAEKAAEALNSTQRLDEARKTGRVPSVMPDTWRSIWFGDARKRPIHVRIPVQGASGK